MIKAIIDIKMRSGYFCKKEVSRSTEMAERNEVAYGFHSREVLTQMKGKWTIAACLTVLLVPAQVLVAFLLLSETLCFEQYTVALIRA